MERKAAALLKLALRRAWGKRPCTHPRLEMENDLNSRVVGWFCSVCGADIYANHSGTGQAGVPPPAAPPGTKPSDRV